MCGRCELHIYEILTVWEQCILSKFVSFYYILMNWQRDRNSTLLTVLLTSSHKTPSIHLDSFTRIELTKSMTKTKQQSASSRNRRWSSSVPLARPNIIYVYLVFIVRTVHRHRSYHAHCDCAAAIYCYVNSNQIK